MVAELKLETFSSGTMTGTIEGDHTVAYVVLCGVSGLGTIPLRCTDEGVLLTGSHAL